MNNCYNIAIKYLIDKYGSKPAYLINSSRIRLSQARNKKERKLIEDSFTDADYVITFNNPTDDNDKLIEALVNQYQYGYSIRFELYNVLVSMKIIK